MEKLKMHTRNLADENFSKLAELFPNAVTESINADGEVVRAIDKDVLMQEISVKVVEGREERYQFTWPDKKKSMLLANSPIAATLRPCREESVNFDTTENLYIEGDNLDVLKLLRETYLGKVKMIYIDPPYNTGKDFVYEDDFSDETGSFLKRDEQYDEQGNRLTPNLDSNGRFHTDWLNMMYPRLKLAKDLLSDDGLIFISIDDNETENLRKMCNELFGESNFICTFVWQKKTGASDSNTIATITEYIHLYGKDKNILKLTKNTNSFDINRYRNQDEYFETRGPYYIDNLDRGGLQYSDSMNFPIVCPDGIITYPNGRRGFHNDGWIWKWGKSKIKWALENGFLEFRKSGAKDSGWSVCYKNYLRVDNENKPLNRAAPHKNLITDIMNTNTSALMKELFGTNNYFDYAKPVELIQKLVSFVYFQDSDIILDFFSGSATTAHAVMQLNAEDGGKRKFIMVQLPEITDEKSEAYKAGYKNICEIGKERIRRAGTKIKAENPLTTTNLDTGFRVLKLDGSNMKDVYYNPSAYTPDLFDELTNNIKEDRTPEDLLFQVMLELGIELSSKIVETSIARKKVFNVAEGFLLACFDESITDQVIIEIAKQKPYYFVMRDSSLADDSVAANFDQIFDTYSSKTIRKVL